MHEREAFLVLICILLFAGCVQPHQNESGTPGKTQTTLTSAACPAGTADCQDRCVNLSSDNQNCGTCGRACPAGHDCKRSECVLRIVCKENETRCSAYNCADLNTSYFDCGACGVKCSSELPVLTCCNGTCKSLQTDPTSCGSCRGQCTSGQVCCAGTCVDSSANPCRCDPACSPGETCCNRRCVDLLKDNENCGECGNACSGHGLYAREFCQSGMCLHLIP